MAGSEFEDEPIEEFNDDAETETEVNETPEADEESPEVNDEAEDADSEDDSDEGEDKEESRAKPKPKKNSVEKRIKEYTYLARQAQREAEAAKRELEQIRAQISNPAQEEITPPNANNKEKYPLGEFDDQYIADREEYLLAKAEQRAYNKLNESRQAEAASQEEKILREKVDNVALAGNEKFEDFEVSVQNALTAYPPDKGALGVLLDDPMAADVLYHLSNNPGVLQRITAQPPMAQAASLSRLSAWLETRQEGEKKAKQKISKASSAPIRNRGSSGKFKVRPDTNDIDAYVRQYGSR